MRGDVKMFHVEQSGHLMMPSVTVDGHRLAEIGGRRERRCRVLELGQVGDRLVDVLAEIFALPVDVDAALDGADEGAKLVHHTALMAAVNHVKAILDALEIRVLSREDGVVLLVYRSMVSMLQASESTSAQLSSVRKKMGPSFGVGS